MKIHESCTIKVIQEKISLDFVQKDHVLEEKHGFEQLYAYQSSPAVYEDKTGKLCTTMNSLVSIARKDGARILQEKIVTNRS